MLVSYYVVTVKEIQLNKIHKNIITNRDENVDLQTKLDNLTTYKKVDSVTKRKNLVQTSQQVIEVKASDEDEQMIKDLQTINFFC